MNGPDPWEGWHDPFAQQARPQQRRPPAAELGPPYGFITSAETFGKVTRRVGLAQAAAKMAVAGKRIASFNEGPSNNAFWQHPFNDADAYAHVAYWLAVAAMGTGNGRIAGAAQKYATSADRWDTVFLRMKDGGISEIYAGATAALRRQAGRDINRGIVKRVIGIFSQQADPGAVTAARARTLEQDPYHIAAAAVRKTVTTVPKASKIPLWVWPVLGGAVLLTLLIVLRPYASAGAALAKKG